MNDESDGGGASEKSDIKLQNFPKCILVGSKDGSETLQLEEESQVNGQIRMEQNELTGYGQKDESDGSKIVKTQDGDVGRSGEMSKRRDGTHRKSL